MRIANKEQIAAGKRTGLLFGWRLVDPHSPRLHNPELTCGTGLREGTDQRLRQNAKGGKKIIGTAEHDETPAGLRGVVKNIGEVQIQGHEDARLGPAVRVERLVIDPGESLVADRCDFVTGPAQYRSQSGVQILVQLQVHGVAVIGMSTKRSRVISAAYARAARMSSMVNVG